MAAVWNENLSEPGCKFMVKLEAESLGERMVAVKLKPHYTPGRTVRICILYNKQYFIMALMNNSAHYFVLSGFTPRQALHCDKSSPNHGDSSESSSDLPRMNYAA